MALRWSLALAGGAAALLGCNPQSYVGDPEVVLLAMDESTAPILAADEGSLFFVERRVELPVVAPSASQLEGLWGMQAQPFPRMPWVHRGDLPFEIDWALTNLTDAPVEVTLTFNGVSEFFEYMPNFTIEDDAVVADYSQWERKFSLEAFASREGTLREEEVDEIAVDLATVVNGAPNANLIVYFENQSDRDPRAEPYIPDVIPGLVGVRVGLQTGAAVPVVLEATVRVRDEGDRLADAEEEPDDVWVLPVPVVFRPMPPPEEE